MSVLVYPVSTPMPRGTGHDAKTSNIVRTRPQSAFPRRNLLHRGLIGLWWAGQGWPCGDGTQVTNIASQFPRLRNGTLKNTAAFGLGQDGHAILLDGDDVDPATYVDVASMAADIDVTKGSMLTWLRLNDANIGGGLNFQEYGRSSTNDDFIGIRKKAADDTYVMRYRVGGTNVDGGGDTTGAPGLITLSGTWGTDNKIKFYVNGVKSSTEGTRTGDIGVALDTGALGGKAQGTSDGAGGNVNGDFLLAAVWDRTLSEKEIRLASIDPLVLVRPAEPWLMPHVAAAAGRLIGGKLMRGGLLMAGRLAG